MPLLEQVLETYPNDVKLLFKAFPLRDHDFAMKAATAALAAEDQGKFWEFHDFLFENYDGLDDEKITDIAVSLELDIEEFHQRMKDPQIVSRVERDKTEGKEAGVSGTPAVFINGRAWRKWTTAGFVAGISAMIDKELESAE